MDSSRPDESPRQFHFHEFRGPVDRSSNLGQRGGKRPGAGRPRLYRDGEKPRYKYRYRYINVSEEVFTKFQRLKFEAGCKAEKNFMILLLELYERHNQSFESCIDVGSSNNLQRWKQIRDQLGLTAEQIARFLLDLAEQHLFKGRCPEGAIFPTVNEKTSQSANNQDSNPSNESEVIVKTEPNDPVVNNTDVNKDESVNFGNLTDLLSRKADPSSQPSAMSLLPSLQLVPVQNVCTPTMIQSPSILTPNDHLNPAQSSSPLVKFPSEEVLTGMSTPDSPASGSAVKNPQPYVTFKWWNVFPSERSKRKSRCNQITSLLASEKSELKQFTSRSNIMKETSGYIPKSISQILPKSPPISFNSSGGNVLKTIGQMPQATSINENPPPDYQTSIAMTTSVSRVNVPCTQSVQSVNSLPMVWSFLPPGGNSVATPPANELTVIPPQPPPPSFEDCELPLNLSLKHGSAPMKTHTPLVVPKIKIEPCLHNDDSPVSQRPDEQKSETVHNVGESILKKPKMSDPKVQRKVQNLMSAISKIGGHNSSAQNKASSNLSEVDFVSKHELSPPNVALPLDTCSKPSRKMSTPSKKVSDVEIKQESKESLMNAIALELSTANSNVDNASKLTNLSVQNATKGGAQKRAYETRSSGTATNVTSEPVKPPDTDGKYYIMNLYKKKKLNDPEFGRWSFAKTRSSGKNGKRQWKINRIENYICKSCGKTFMSEKWFIKHVEAEHCGKNKDMKCLSEEIQATASVESPQSQVEFTCSVCAKTFMHETELFLHKSSGPCHKKDDYMTEGFHRCTYTDCCRIFSSEYNLFQHTKRCHDLSELPV